MSYLDDLAMRIHRAAHPDQDLPDHDLPDDQRALYLMYALIAVTVGDKVCAAHVHDAWSAWASLALPGHPSIRPYDELPEHVQRKDDRYVDAIRRALS